MRICVWFFPGRFNRLQYSAALSRPHYNTSAQQTLFVAQSVQHCRPARCSKRTMTTKTTAPCKTVRGSMNGGWQHTCHQDPPGMLHLANQWPRFMTNSVLPTLSTSRNRQEPTAYSARLGGTDARLIRRHTRVASLVGSGCLVEHWLTDKMWQVGAGASGTPPTCPSTGKGPEIDGPNAQCCLDKDVAHGPQLA